MHGWWKGMKVDSFKLRGWSSFVHFCSLEPSTHVTDTFSMPYSATTRKSDGWIFKRGLDLVNNGFWISFNKLYSSFLALRLSHLVHKSSKTPKIVKISNFIDSQDNLLIVWNTKSWSNARGDLVKKNSRSSTTSFSWKFKKINFWVSTWAILN